MEPNRRGALQSSLHSHEEADFYTVLRKRDEEVSEILERAEVAKTPSLSHRRQMTDIIDRVRRATGSGVLPGPCAI